MVAASGDLVDGGRYPRAVIGAVRRDFDPGCRWRGGRTFVEQPAHRVAVAFLGVEQLDGVVGDHNAGAGPEHSCQRSVRRQTLL